MCNACLRFGWRSPRANLKARPGGSAEIVPLAAALLPEQRVGLRVQREPRTAGT